MRSRWSPAVRRRRHRDSEAGGPAATEVRVEAADPADDPAAAAGPADGPAGDPGAAEGGIEGPVAADPVTDKPCRRKGLPTGIVNSPPDV